MINTEAIRKMFRADAVTPGAAVFPDIDTERLRSELKLSEKGRDRGRANQPPADALSLDSVEIAAVAEMERLRRGGLENYEANKRIFSDRLARGDMDGIVHIQLARLMKRLAGRKIVLDLDDAAREWLAEKGYDPVYGARPLKRVIQRHLQDPLAQMLLSGSVMDGASVPVGAGPEGLIIAGQVQADAADDDGAAPRMKLVH